MKTNRQVEGINTRMNWYAVACALFACWVLPVFVMWLSRSEEDAKAIPLAVGLGVGLPLMVYFFNRAKSWSVILWVPLVAFGVIGTLFVAGSVLEQPSGGPDAAPLEGVATLMGLGLALLLGLLTASCLILRPKFLPFPTVTLAVTNTLVMLLVMVNGIPGVTGQDIILHVIDRDQKPVSGASVIFERFGYGPGGSQVFDEKGGPIESDENGIVIIPSRRMRYETHATITKPDCRDVMLTIGMQFNASDKHRRFVISTYDSRALAYGNLPATDPVRATVFLASKSDGPDPALKHMNLYSKNDVGDAVPRFLNIETGKFSADQPADLQLEMFAELNENYWEPRLRIIGLNGTEVLQVPNELSLTEPISPYEHVYRIAPESGYQSKMVVLKPCGSPGQTIYIRARDGRLHGRLNLDAQGDGRQLRARYSGDLFINNSGSRRLE